MESDQEKWVRLYIRLYIQGGHADRAVVIAYNEPSFPYDQRSFNNKCNMTRGTKASRYNDVDNPISPSGLQIAVFRFNPDAKQWIT
ncbi:predicted protein [Lichtheimia corymbifera JMRC:FSU:9682]|uniref:Uncharacterized protein n=1 Tax=Lichtheimia corymbifera JMRC:FSU:9682 TaxID=1263082 RepID=A0A068SAU8_9FUNG|nr:predicted protein [Lichtheimia corymbifera JMRC:FSU:9682]